MLCIHNVAGAANSTHSELDIHLSPDQIMNEIVVNERQEWSSFLGTDFARDSNIDYVIHSGFTTPHGTLR